MTGSTSRTGPLRYRATSCGGTTGWGKFQPGAWISPTSNISKFQDPSWHIRCTCVGGSGVLNAYRKAGVSTALLILLAAGGAAHGSSQRWTERLSIRDHPQVLHLYGRRDGDPVIVSSGDGGWIHLGPHVAEMLSDRGCFVVGFDVKAYLTAFTAGPDALRTSDVPRDFETLAAFASRTTGRKPILIGVSEGAGLSVLAAADANAKRSVAGVIGL
jgi:hypothetical protein